MISKVTSHVHASNANKKIKFSFSPPLPSDFPFLGPDLAQPTLRQLVGARSAVVSADLASKEELAAELLSSLDRHQKRLFWLQPTIAELAEPSTTLTGAN